jgi:acyl-coenzyme A synthetase/AMP-(fatty) acid ligase
MIDDRFFYLLGRNRDLVKIGGKRESLSGLSYKLKKIEAFKCSGVAIRIFGSGVSNAIC